MKKTILGMVAVSAIAFVGFTGALAPDNGSTWKADAKSKTLKNPLASDKSSAKKGAKIFKMRCVVCHGEKGLGDGVGGKALTPKPANFHSERVQKQTDGEIFWKITNGKGAMIKWGPIIKENDRWNLVNYIRTFKSK